MAKESSILIKAVSSETAAAADIKAEKKKNAHKRASRA